MAPPSTRAALENLTLADADALDCGVCCLPLKPPIFQCGVGHALCEQCRGKLASARTCHVCRAPMADGYRRNHDLERLVEPIRAPCPNAAYGRAARPVYYDGPRHLEDCLHAPCHCPEEACGFVGSTEMLLAHFAGEHEWPCTTGARAGESFSVDLEDGFNVVIVGDGARELLFLVMVSPVSLGRAVSAVCVCPRTDGGDEIFYGVELEFERLGGWYGERLKSFFNVECTNLSSGLPDPDHRFQFLLPNSVKPYEAETINIQACIYTQIQ
ncbi:hypothetical protein CFC21_018824 [Triticum aestivum]|uniref:RING-type E3 ubiquitin transferase n=2 Tax=Triticum aestivum TaxID=4565 RepID=A0A3B6B3Z2_WHEAT|nr:hypothetical protein CFC21_018824 [Triticum aestivum]